VRIGDIDLLPLNDGACALPQDFYTGVDFATHPELLGADGLIHMPIGCFLLRNGDSTVLVDAGIGNLRVAWARGGELPGALRAAGVEPEDIEVVVCSHLHLDHIGWLAVDDEPFFPNATVRYGSADWGPFVTERENTDWGRRIMEVLADAERLEPMDGDMVAVAPGLTARHTPGHTLGHYGLVVSSGDQRAVLLGDAVECPLQLEEPDLAVLSDVDPALAARTRESMWRELEGTSTQMIGSHFPGLAFGRVLGGQGQRYFATA
jgi:glyoxylase-like metal-dependent hydrolase (beta-lactamase superfamily II)